MIIITGASGGVGTGIVDDLSKVDDVIAIYNKNKPEIRGSDPITYEQLDLLNADEIQAFVKKYRTGLSKVTLVHGAAVKVDGLAIQYKDEDWDQVMNVNLRSAYQLSKALLPVMIKDGWGAHCIYVFN